MPRDVSYSWTQPLCVECWPDWTGTDAEPVTVMRADREECCHCGAETTSGIYIRIDPQSHFCAHPTAERG